MGRALIYCRVSPKPKENDSIAAQAEDLQQWCAENELKVHSVSYDEEVSGAIRMFDRPGLSCLLGHLYRGDVMVVRNCNRIARSGLVGLMLEEELARIGARLAVLESGGFQPSKEEDVNLWFARAVGYLVADMQRVTMNARTSRRMLQHMESGRAMGGTAPYGYSIEGDALIVNEDEQMTIEEIMTMRDGGNSLRDIAARLERIGIPARAKNWHQQTIKRIIDRYDRDAKKIGRRELN